MPKGGDLYNHYSGSVYAESYIKWVIEKNYFVNKKTLEVAEKNPTRDTAWSNFSDLIKGNELDSIKYALLKKWSLKDYNGESPADKLFFEAFGGFNEASELNLDSGLLELKAGARAENVSYIETMLSTVPANISTADLAGFFDPHWNIFN